MTSSLVGSEMCIRDRQKGKRGRRTEVERVAPPWWPASPKTKTGSEKSTCLLYTSDAADDM
eukprot:7487482-Prorocentrum_lima.AAC.1